MNVRVNIQPTVTFASERSAIKEANSYTHPDGRPLRYLVVPTKANRYCLVFIGARALKTDAYLSHTIVA